MKLKSLFLMIMLLAGNCAFIPFASAAQGDMWLNPNSLTLDSEQNFNMEIHIDTGGEELGAFDIYFDFDDSEVAINTSSGEGGISLGSDMTAWDVIEENEEITDQRRIVMINDEDLANGHLRIAGICADNCPSGTDEHIITVHARTTSGFTSGSSDLSLRVNNLSDTLGVEISAGTLTNATIESNQVDTDDPSRSNGSPDSELDDGTSQTTISLSTNEAATCKYDTSSGQTYSAMDNTFSTTGGTSHSSSVSGLSDGGSYSYYVRCEDADGNENTSDYVISFTVDTEETSSSNDSSSSDSSSDSSSSSSDNSTSDNSSSDNSSSDTSTDTTTDTSTNTDTTTEATPVVETPAEVFMAIKLKIKEKGMYAKLKGKILLKVEDSGRAFYIHPQKEEGYFLGRPRDAFQVMREQGVGITNADLEKIPMGLKDLSGADTDGDGLPDTLEEAIGTDKTKADTDGDGYNDKLEIVGGYNPKGSGKLSSDEAFGGKHLGKIFLQVESKGEAWYVHDNRRFYLGRPADAFQVMRELSLGISNSDFSKFGDEEEIE